MKNSGTCPKCDGVDLIRRPAPGGALVVGLYAVPVVQYICFTCGFSEEWVESRAGLERLRDANGFARDDPSSPSSGTSGLRELGLA